VCRTCQKNAPKNRFARVLANLTDPPSARTVAGRQSIARAVVDVLTVDECVARHTAMKTLAEIIACTLRDGYTPSLYTTARGTSVYRFELAFTALRIADAYDQAMAKMGRKERAFRGS
jgi:hypothetical protein